MSDRITKHITEKAQINKALNWLDTTLCKALEAGPVAFDLYRPEDPRNNIQSSKFHAMVSDLQKQAVIKMPGRRIVLAEYDLEAVKALLVIWYANERALMGEPLAKPPRSIICPVTGERISIRPSTAKWSKKDASGFVEFLYCLGVDTEVRWSEPAIQAYNEYRESQS